MTQIDNVRRVIDDSSPDQWFYCENVASQLSVPDEQGTICYIYEEDVNIRLERGPVAVRDFDEPWVPGPASARSYEWWLGYGSSPVERFVIVNIDQNRAEIPVPDGRENPTLSRRKAKVGRILDHHPLGTFNDYIDRADITIE